MDLRFLLIFLLFLLVPAHALFLAGQSEQGGAVFVLCEGQRFAFLSPPSGELRALPLDSDSQASFAPASSGPHTIQCGNETKTISVSLPASAGQGAYPGGDSFFLAAGAAAVFLAALLLAARIFLKPCTTFTKSASGNRVSLSLRAGRDLRGIRISDPQGGEGGSPIALSIPHLPAGASWGWEYEMDSGGPLIAARMEAKCADGAIFSMASGMEAAGVQKGAGKGKREGRKLARCPLVTARGPARRHASRPPPP